MFLAAVRDGTEVCASLAFFPTPRGEIGQLHESPRGKPDRWRLLPRGVRPYGRKLPCQRAAAVAGARLAPAGLLRATGAETGPAPGLGCGKIPDGVSTGLHGRRHFERPSCPCAGGQRGDEVCSGLDGTSSAGSAVGLDPVHRCWGEGEKDVFHNRSGCSQGMPGPSRFLEPPTPPEFSFPRQFQSFRINPIPIRFTLWL